MTTITDIDGCPDMVRVEVVSDRGIKIFYRKRDDVDAKPSRSVARVSCKNPFRSPALGLHESELAKHIETTNIPKGVSFERSNHGHVDPVFDSLPTWRKYLKATGRHDRDGYE